MRSCWVILCFIVAGGLVGCTPDSEVSEYEGALRQAKTCGEVLEAIQEDAIAKVDLELKAFEDDNFYGRGGPIIFDGFGVAEGAPDGVLAPAAGGDADAPSGVSDTNRQVASVDEADIVKVGDGGTKLYVIRDNGFYEFDSWPAAETSKVADLQIEGYAIEMFVEGNRAVVFSNVFGVEALGGGDLCNGGPEPVGIAADGAYYCGPSYVKTTVVSLEGTAPEVIREIYLEGYYTSSRRHDNIVRAVVQTNMQHPPTVPQLWEVLYNAEPYPETREEQIARARLWAAAAKAAIRETTLEEWLPSWGERVEGEIQARAPQCTDFYAPSPGFTDYGMTQILGIDIADGSDATITSILGWASQVYANAEALILTQPDYGWFDRDIDYDRTAVHRFAVSFAAQRTPYQGSGFVPGMVNDQFSIDEASGVIRIATTRTTWKDLGNGDVWIPPVTHNFVSTMSLGDGLLTVMGATPPLAEGERIFSARFIGDLGYIVTFRQIDPLFAIDLSDPSNPTVLGALKIPGFSDYMHPLGDDHLLTIGRDIDEQTQFDNGTALQIFDVSDPADPRQKFKALVGEGFSEANHNHKAFNFYDERGLLAFPFVSYETGFSSTLELWDVSADTGFSRRGSVDHSALVLDGCGGWEPPVGPFVGDAFYENCQYLPQVSRGVFIDEYIYSISHGGVLVHNVGDLETPVATATY
ncbi:MAG: beta-propeller domain-containing protein [Myxococcales bacterium]|nr:beta-propeller domain-containing protein [Myxococcales bacterium]MDH3484234.1 beta-propeller domain-containing protein [Myxococcales bacterium]